MLRSFTNLWVVQQECLASLPTLQYNMLRFTLYLGPLFLTIFGTFFVVAILVMEFSILKASVKHVSIKCMQPSFSPAFTIDCRIGIFSFLHIVLTFKKCRRCRFFTRSVSSFCGFGNAFFMAPPATRTRMIFLGSSLRP